MFNRAIIRKTVVLATLACLTSAHAAYAQTLNPDNGHYYQLLTARLNWTDARDAANALTFNGQQGYLTTITSAAENTFITSIAAGNDVNIGFTDEVTEGTFLWVTGEAVTYTNWNGGEPNNSNNEDYAELYSSGNWNDIPNNFPLFSVVEFNPAAVPEPGSLALLLGIGVSGTIFARRRKQASKIA